MLEIKVVGAGCSTCSQLAENTREAADALGLEYTLEDVTDMDRMIELGVLTTPALVVDGAVKVLGKAASVDELKRVLGTP